MRVVTTIQRVTTLIALTVLASFLLASPASAGAEVRRADAVITKMAGTTVTADQSVCEVWAGPYQGYMFCNTWGVGVFWYGGKNDAGNDIWREEKFVIGTNCALYHAYQQYDGLTWNPWARLGGCLINDRGPLAGSSYRNLDIKQFNSGKVGVRLLTIIGIGTDNHYWCLDWPWNNPWYRC